MAPNIAEVVRQFKQHPTSPRELQADTNACRKAGLMWRDGLSNPVVTVQLISPQNGRPLPSRMHRM